MNFKQPKKQIQKILRFYEEDLVLLKHIKKVDDFNKYIKELIHNDISGNARIKNDNINATDSTINISIANDNDKEPATKPTKRKLSRKGI